jgi:hypothetical protein
MGYRPDADTYADPHRNTNSDTDANRDAYSDTDGNAWTGYVCQ